MSVKLRKRLNADGSTSLYLDIYVNGERTYNFLSELKLKKASSQLDREVNREKLKMAQEVLAKSVLEVAENEYDIFKFGVLPASKWMENYVSTYKKKDKRNIEGAKNRFFKFLVEVGRSNVKMKEIDESLVLKYKDFLQDTSQGEGAHSYFARFKKMIKQAVRDRVLRFDPCAGVRAPKGKAKIKDILTFDEIQLLANVHTENALIKNAFLFCCLTGLRWADVVILKWDNIDFRNKELRLRQIKTDQDLHIKLNGNAIQILESCRSERTDSIVFQLPSANYANEEIQKIVDRAGIKKKITWHCARHTFGTNLLYYGTDVFTASRLLGHSSLKHTQRYVRAAEDMKQKAVDNLPFLNLMITA